MVVSMRLPMESAKRLRKLANRYGWTPSDASARLVEEGLRRTEFAFIDFRDTAAGRQACIQASSLSVWEVMQLVRGYKGDAASAAKHLGWPLVKVQAAIHYAEVYPQEINEAIADNQAADVAALRNLLPQTVEFSPKKSVSR
jgi:uncharacterized protein (DUF433 family)